MMKRYNTCAVLLLVLTAGTWGTMATKSIADVDPESGKTPLIEMTKALFKEAARLSTTSEVLTLNLTNLVILFVIKAIIFGFGFFGAGAGRSFHVQEKTFDEADLMMMMSFMLGSSTEDYSCLYRVACDEPSKAHQYLTASKMLLKGSKYVKGAVSYQSKYEDIIYGLQEAVELRNNGGQCHQQYVCKQVPSSA